MVVKYCSASFCNNNSKKFPELKFHRFPANTKIKQKWWSFCQRKEKTAKRGFVCSDHFKESDYSLLKIALNPNEQNKYALKRDSIPTILSAYEPQIKDEEDVSEIFGEDYLAPKEELEEFMEIEETSDPLQMRNQYIYEEIEQLKVEIHNLEATLFSKKKRLTELEGQLNKNTSNIDLDDTLPSSEENLHVPMETELCDSVDDIVDESEFATNSEDNDSKKQPDLDIIKYIEELEKRNEEILKGAIITPATANEAKKLFKSKSTEKAKEPLIAPEFVIVSGEIEDAHQEPTEPLVDPCYVISTPATDSTKIAERQEEIIKIEPNPKVILYPPKKNERSKVAFTEVTKIFGCPECNDVFKHQRTLDSHMRLKHPPSDGFKCKFCDRKFEKYEVYRRHELLHTPKTCEVCGKICKNSKQYSKHKRFHKPDKRFGCDYCDKRFHMKMHLENHVRTHSGEKPFQCEQCGASFRQSYCLTLHLRRHQNIYHECEKCKSQFPLLSCLKKHLEKCNGTYRKAKTLKPLRPDWRNNTVNIIKCSLKDCEFKCKSEITYNKHLKNHHKIEVIDTKCKYCDAVCENEEEWAKHVRKHELKNGRSRELGETYDCDICGNHFGSKDKLGNHVLVFHTNIENRAYKCTLCETFFKKPEHLKIHHTWKHSNARPFKCSHCEFASPSKSDLKFHMKRHLNTRDFKCRLCNYATRSSSCLRKHFEIMHNCKEIYECETCKDTFQYFDELREHRKTKHPH